MVEVTGFEPVSVVSFTACCISYSAFTCRKLYKTHRAYHATKLETGGKVGGLFPHAAQQFPEHIVHILRGAFFFAVYLVAVYLYSIH